VTPPESVAFRDILAIVVRRGRLFRRFVGFCTLATALFVYLLPPTYKASVLFMVQRDATPTLTQLSKPNWLVDRDEVIQTEVALLKSGSVIGRAVDALGLVGRPKSQKPLARARRAVISGLKTAGLLYSATEREEWVEWVRRHVKVKPVVQSDVIKVTVDGEDPALVGEIGAALSRAYRERHAEVFRNEDVYAFYQDQVASSANALQQLKARQESLKTKSGLTSFDEQRDALLAQKGKIDEQRRALAEASAVLLAGAQALVSDPDLPSSSVSIPAVIAGQFAAVAALHKSLADAEQKRAEIARAYRDESDPRVVALTKKLPGLRAGLAKSLTSAAKDVDAQVAALDEASRAIESRFVEFNKNERLLTDLTVEIGLALQRYTRYTERLEDARLNAGTEGPVVNISVIDESATPSRPAQPRVVFIVLALVLSSVLGIGIVIVAEHADPGVHSPRDAARRLGLPVLAAIPLLPHEEGNTVSGARR
jgi:uncharacterized protein involved in exopolysaccharide biosynthesis